MNSSDFRLPPQTIRIALFWIITQRVVVTSYRSFGTAYHSNLQGQVLFCTLNMRRTGRTETPVRSYQYPLRNNAEERSFPTNLSLKFKITCSNL